MGSVKDLIQDSSAGGVLYKGPSATDFGRGAWRVSGRFSVADLKELIPPVEIPGKAEILTMVTASYFEYLANFYPWIETCYLGLLDKDGKLVDVKTLVDRGETSNIIVMRLAHVPATFCIGNLQEYRDALLSGRLQCAVADVESIFRAGYPLGSSTFEKLAKTAGLRDEYLAAATYAETESVLNKIREKIAEEGAGSVPGLQSLMDSYHLNGGIPHPGFMLQEPVFDTTTKFETAGDREISKEEARKLTGLDEEGYNHWISEVFPSAVKAQLEFTRSRGIVNMDGKMECVTWKGKPVITDFACTPDENRLMIATIVNGEEWAIPTNKEIQRALFRKEGIYTAVDEAKHQARKNGNGDNWRTILPGILKERKIDLVAITEESCKLMGYALAEVGNRLLQKKVFDSNPLETWIHHYLPYASRITNKETAENKEAENKAKFYV